jgi:hypothetical protein
MSDNDAGNLHSTAFATVIRKVSRRGPQEASRQLRGQLLLSFRRHRRRRRLVRAVTAATATLVIAGGVIWRVERGKAGSPTAPIIESNMESNMLRRAMPKPANTGGSNRATFGHRPTPTAPISGEQMQPFIALPSFAFKVAGEELRVVRVEMPVSSLRQLGVRVNDELITRRVIAELLVGPDGTPYAFRLLT